MSGRVPGSAQNPFQYSYYPDRPPSRQGGSSSSSMNIYGMQPHASHSGQMPYAGQSLYSMAPRPPSAGGYGMPPRPPSASGYGMPPRPPSASGYGMTSHHPSMGGYGMPPRPPSAAGYSALQRPPPVRVPLALRRHPWGDAQVQTVPPSMAGRSPLPR